MIRPYRREAMRAGRDAALELIRSGQPPANPYAPNTKRAASWGHAREQAERLLGRIMEIGG